MTQLAVKRLGLIEYSRNTHHCEAEAGTPIEVLTDPKYWANVSGRLRPRDHIEVDAADGSYFVKLRVLDCGRLFARVAVLEKHEFKNADPTGKPPETGEFEVKWAGPSAKWRVVRVADKAPMSENHESRDSADSWLKNHLKENRAG